MCGSVIVIQLQELPGIGEHPVTYTWYLYKKLSCNGISINFNEPVLTGGEAREFAARTHGKLTYVHGIWDSLVELRIWNYWCQGHLGVFFEDMASVETELEFWNISEKTTTTDHRVLCT